MYNSYKLTIENQENYFRKIEDLEGSFNFIWLFNNGHQLRWQADEGKLYFYPKCTGNGAAKLAMCSDAIVEECFAQMEELERHLLKKSEKNRAQKVLLLRTKDDLEAKEAHLKANASM